MKKWILGLVLVSMVAGARAQQAVLNKLKKNRVVLPHGWSLTPAGHTMPLGELPGNMVVSSTGKYLAVTHNGGNAGDLQLIDAEKEKVLDATGIPAFYVGLKFSEDERFLYTLKGNGNSILKYGIVHNKLVLSDSIVPDKKWQSGTGPAGLDIDDKRQLMYVVTRLDHSLYLVDLAQKTFVQRLDLAGEGVCCLLSENKEWLYILCKGSDKVYLFDTKTARFAGTITVGNDPNDLCLTRDGHTLFVASNEDHAVSVIDLGQQKVIQVFNTALFSGVPSAFAANAVALGEDETTLYIANADNNCLMVWDISHPGSGEIKGFVPVGWYPTSVKLAGGKLFVANGKGFSSLSGAPVRYHNGTNDWSKEVRYIVDLFTGSLSVLDEPEDKLMGVYSQLVYQNCPYRQAKELLKQPTAMTMSTEPSQPSLSMK